MQVGILSIYNLLTTYLPLEECCSKEMSHSISISIQLIIQIDVLLVFPTSLPSLMHSSALFGHDECHFMIVVLIPTAT